MAFTPQIKKLKVMIIGPLPPPDHGGIANWSRIVRKELDGRDDLELLFVNTTKLYRRIPGMQTLSRLIFGSYQAMRVIYTVLRSMRANHPDILHLNSSGCYGTIRDIIILYLARILKIPTIIHYHMQQPPAEIIGYVYWKFLLWAMSLADFVVLLDKRSEARVGAALPDINVVRLPNMVEIDVIDELTRKLDLPPLAPGPVARIVFSGFVTLVKGVRELVEACTQLTDQNFILDIVGTVTDTALKLKLETIANRSSKSNWLCFHGGVDHAAVLEYMLAADLFVLPSHAESAPMVVIEAMGCGKPVVSTATGAIPEMLDIGGPQECGICVPPRNVAALAEAIRRLIRDPDLRRRFGCIARRRAEQFYSVPVGCKQLVDLWSFASRKNNL